MRELKRISIKFEKFFFWIFNLLVEIFEELFLDVRNMENVVDGKFRGRGKVPGDINKNFHGENN